MTRGIIGSLLDHSPSDLARLQKNKPSREAVLGLGGATAIGPGLAADLLGIQTATLKRRTRLGVYPVFVDSRGYWWYSVETLQEIARGGQLVNGSFDPPPIILTAASDERRPRESRGPVHKPRIRERPALRLDGETPLKTMLKPIGAQKGGAYDAETAKLAFTEFEKGVSPIALTTEHNIHPTTVRALVEAYAILKGALIVDSSVRERLETLPLKGERPFKTGEQLYNAIRLGFSRSCGRCGRSEATVCGSCFETKQIEKQVAAAARGSEEAKPKYSPGDTLRQWRASHQKVIKLGFVLGDQWVLAEAHTNVHHVDLHFEHPALLTKPVVRYVPRTGAMKPDPPAPLGEHMLTELRAKVEEVLASGEVERANRPRPAGDGPVNSTTVDPATFARDNADLLRKLAMLAPTESNGTSEKNDP